MNRRLLWLGLAAFLTGLVVWLPVRWVVRFLPKDIVCAEWAGSVWRGQCTGLVYQQRGQAPLAVDFLRWQLHPLGLLQLSLKARIQVRTAQGNGSAEVALAGNGDIAAQEVNASAVFDHRLATMLPADWTGQLEAHGLSLHVRGNRLLQLGGELALQDFHDSSGNRFGSYRLRFTPGSKPPFMAALQDTGGPLDVRGSLSMSANQRWQLNGTVTARPDASPALRAKLDFLGGPDNTGRYPLSSEGSFK